MWQPTSSLLVVAQTDVTQRPWPSYMCALWRKVRGCVPVLTIISLRVRKWQMMFLLQRPRNYQVAIMLVLLSISLYEESSGMSNSNYLRSSKWSSCNYARVTWGKPWMLCHYSRSIFADPHPYHGSFPRKSLGLSQHIILSCEQLFARPTLQISEWYHLLT